MGLLRGPDGQIVNVPDDQVGSAVASGYEPVSLGQAADTTTAAPKQDTGVVGDVGAAASSFLSGATLGTSDLALKHILPPAGYKQLAADREDHPWISGAGQLVGTIAPSLASGGTLTPAGYLSSVTQDAAEGGLGKSLAAAGFEGATQNAGAYLADAALGDRDATAEGMVGALGTGFAFGAGGGAAAHGVESGTIAARRMFARIMDGGPEVAQAAEQAWKSTSQEVLEAHDQAAEIAKAKLAAARTARDQAAVARDQASAGLAEAKLAAPGLDADHAAAVGLDQAISKVPDDLSAFAQRAANPPAVTTGDVESLHDLAQKVDAYTAARRELDEMMARVEPDHELEDAMGRFEVPGQIQTPAGDAEGGVPRGEFGEPGKGGFKSQNELGRLAADRGDASPADQAPSASSADETKASRPKSRPGQPEPASREPVLADPGGPTVDRSSVSYDAERFGPASEGKFKISGSDGSTEIVDQSDMEQWVRDHTPNGFQPGVRHYSPFSIKVGIPNPADVKTPYELSFGGQQVIYVVKPSELAAHGVFGNEIHPGHASGIESARGDNKLLPHVLIDVTPDGKLYIEDGNHRINHAATTDSPVLAQFRAVGEGWEPQSRAHDVSDRIRRRLPDQSTPPASDLTVEPKPTAQGSIPDYESIKASDQDPVTTVLASEIKSRGWYEMPGQGEDRVKAANAAEAMKAGQRDPVQIVVSPSGKLFVNDGRNRLNAAVDLGLPIKVKWGYGREPADHDIFKGGGVASATDNPSAHVADPDLAKDLPPVTRGRVGGTAEVTMPVVNPEPPTELEKLLQGTKSRLDSGSPLGKIASESPAREAYVLDKAATRERQAAEFRAAAMARRSATEPETDLERALRGTKEGLDSGKSMRELRMARGTGEHPLAVKQLELAHDEALDRAAAAPDPVTRSQAMREAKAIEREMTKVGARPGAVEDVAAMAGVVTKVEKAGTELTEALGKDAPPTAQKAAAAYRDAESVAERKTLARTARAADDHAASIADAATPPAGKRSARMAESQVIVDPATGSRHLVHPETGEISPPLGEGFKDRNPGPTGKSKIDEARAAKLRADADLATARAAEGKARIEARSTARTAKDARAAAEAVPVPNGPVKTSIGSKLVAAAKVAGAASAMGIPGIPSVHDIPVIGPLLSAYIKYRTLKAAAGRFVGRVPATADARAAALAAKVKDALAHAVDRSLGLVERNQSAIRTSMVAASAKAGEALRRRAIDDGHPNASKDASTSELAAVRMREVAAAATDPSIVTKMVRAQMRDVIDPDLIAAAESHLIAMYKHLNDTAPKGPPPNPYTVTPWKPSAAEALQWARRLAVANDPRVALDALETQTLTPEAADTLRAVYPKLFAAAQQRLIQRAQDLTNPVPYRQLLQNSLLFDLSLVPSLDPTNAAILSQAHSKSSPPASSVGVGGGAPGAPPVPSIANTTNLSQLYQQTTADRPGMR